MADFHELMNDEEKDVFVSRYEDLKFISVVDDIVCGRCHRVAIYHYYTDCQHVVCRNCKNILCEPGTNAHKCPVCRNNITEIGFQDINFELKVNAVQVECPNTKYGCHFKGTFYHTAKHLKQCEDTLEAALPVELVLPHGMEAVLDHLRKLGEKVQELQTKNVELEKRVVELEPFKDESEPQKNVQGPQKNVQELQEKVQEPQENVQELKNKILNLESQNSMMKSKYRELKNSLVATKKKLKGQTDILVRMLDQKEDRYNQKLAQVNSEMALVSETNKIQGKITDLNRKVDKVTEQVTTLQTSHKALDIKETKTRLDDFLSQMSIVRLELNLMCSAIEERLRNQLMKVKDETDRKTDILNQTSEETLNKFTKLEMDTDYKMVIAIQQIYNETSELQKKMEEQWTSMKTCYNELYKEFENEKTKMNAEVKQLRESIGSNEKTLKDLVTFEIENDQTEIQLDALMAFEAQFKKQELKLQNSQLNNELYEFDSLVYSWTIDAIEEKMVQKTFQCESDVFPLIRYKFGAKARLTIKEDDYVYMSICFVDNKNDGKPIEFVVIPQVKLILRDQSGEEDNNKDIIRPFDFLFGDKCIYGNYILERKIANKSLFTNNSSYAIGGSVVMDILVEPPSLVQQVHCTDGVMTWKITSYKQKKALERDELVLTQHSPYFYTSPQGYRVQVWILLDGFGDYKRKGLTAIVVFLTGQFDHCLQKSFKHRTIVTVFNQKDLTKKLVKVVERDVAKSRLYLINIAPHSEIDRFLLHNTLVYRVAIEPIEDQ